MLQDHPVPSATDVLKPSRKAKPPTPVDVEDIVRRVAEARRWLRLPRTEEFH